MSLPHLHSRTLRACIAHQTQNRPPPTPARGDPPSSDAERVVPVGFHRVVLVRGLRDAYPGASAFAADGVARLLGRPAGVRYGGMPGVWEQYMDRAPA